MTARAPHRDGLDPVPPAADRAEIPSASHGDGGEEVPVWSAARDTADRRRIKQLAPGAIERQGYDGRIGLGLMNRTRPSPTSRSAGTLEVAVRRDDVLQLAWQAAEPVDSPIVTAVIHDRAAFRSWLVARSKTPFGADPIVWSFTEFSQLSISITDPHGVLTAGAISDDAWGHLAHLAVA